MNCPVYMVNIFGQSLSDLVESFHLRKLSAANAIRAKRNLLNNWALKVVKDGGIRSSKDTTCNALNII